MNQSILPLKIEFNKLEFGTTFYDPRTQTNWVKIDEDGAVKENDPYDIRGSFGKNEKVIVN